MTILITLIAIEVKPSIGSYLAKARGCMARMEDKIKGRKFLYRLP
jgi:hypothetical protein